MLVRHDLELDLGAAGDLTSEAVLPAGAAAVASLVLREEGRLCGLDVALLAFELVGGVRIERLAADGDDLPAGAAVARLAGSARSILAAERTALNLLSHLSGVATATRAMCRAVAGSGAGITCTRKTTPGLRALEKYAVRVGGGVNHRLGLGDGVLVKDNHLALSPGIAEALRRAREALGAEVLLQVEVESLDELEAALAAGADALLLDNFSIPNLRLAVRRVAGRVPVEASGGITAANVAEVAASGVDRISIGWMTHSAPALDTSLEMEVRRA